MAGAFPDAPSRRMALDVDGSLGGSRFASGTQALQEFTDPEMVTLQKEDLILVTIGGGSQPDEYFFYIFPELREFDGIYIRANIINILSTVHSSGDTTNTFDGTWTQRIANYDDSAVASLTTYRTEITSTAVPNVRGIRGQFDATGSGKSLSGFHIYGEISAGETPDRLLWIDNDDDLEFSKPQDYGDVPRGSAEDHVVYLKNNSALLAANSVQVTAEDLVGGSGGWYTFDDGTGFSATKSLASSISNGANSPNITIRRITPDAETLGVHAARAFVSVGSWT